MTTLEQRCRRGLEASWTVGDREDVRGGRLMRLGYGPQAAELARGITETVTGEGQREFYDPHDGCGMSASDFAWSALALELPDPGGASAGIPGPE